MNDAKERFRRLGFSIQSTGTHSALKTHNAMIDLPRPGGTYIELIAMQPGLQGTLIEAIGASPGLVKLLSFLTPSALDARMILGAPGLRDRGFVDYACAPPPQHHRDFEGMVAQHQGFFSRGFHYPQDQSSSTGQQMHFTISIPANKDCPFVCKDNVIREIPPESVAHANGAQGFKRLAVLVSDLNEAAQRLIAHYGCIREDPEGIFLSTTTQTQSFESLAHHLILFILLPSLKQLIRQDSRVTIETLDSLTGINRSITSNTMTELTC